MENRHSYITRRCWGLQLTYSTSCLQLPYVASWAHSLKPLGCIPSSFCSLSVPQGHTATKPDKTLWASPAPSRERQQPGPGCTPSVPEKAGKMRRDAAKTEDMTPPSGKRREKYKGSKEKKKSFHFVPINHLDNCTGPQHIHKQTHRVLIAAFVLYI